MYLNLIHCWYRLRQRFEVLDSAIKLASNRLSRGQEWNIQIRNTDILDPALFLSSGKSCPILCSTLLTPKWSVDKHQIDIAPLIGGFAFIELRNRFHQIIVNRRGRVLLVRRHVFRREKRRRSVRNIVADHLEMSKVLDVREL
jgi:hypothetical protein